MRKIVIGVVCAFIIMMSIFYGFFFFFTKVEVVKNESWFSDFEIQNGETLIYCELTLKNNSNAPTTFSVKGVFDKDYESGLVSDKVVTGYFEDSGETSITLGPQEKVSNKRIVFKSKNNGCEIKQDRELPELRIE